MVVPVRALCQLVLAEPPARRPRLRATRRNLVSCLCGRRGDRSDLVRAFDSTALSITAGVVEEIVYRGFVLWYLANFMPLWAALLLSSVFFGLGHSYQGKSGALRTGLVGLVFAILYVMSGSIWWYLHTTS